MSIWPTDDPAIPLATRILLFPEQGNYEGNEVDYLKRNDPEAGPGHGQILDIWGRVRFVAQGTVKARNSVAKYLQYFWRANRATTFSFFDQEEGYFVSELIGTGNGAATTFDIPAKVTGSIQIYVNGVLKSAGVDYTISVATGTDGKDRVIFTVAVPNTHQIRATYDGRHFYVCEFVEPLRVSSVGASQKSISFSVREY